MQDLFKSPSLVMEGKGKGSVFKLLLKFAFKNNLGIHTENKEELADVIIIEP